MSMGSADRVRAHTHDLPAFIDRAIPKLILSFQPLQDRQADRFQR
jgi:hypothetical protein